MQANQKTYELVPGVGAPPLRLGMTTDEVRAVLGEPERGSVDGAWYGLGGYLLLNFLDGDQVVDRLTFLEFSAGPIQVTYKGVSVFEVPPAEAAKVFERQIDDFLCVDFEADVGLSSDDGEIWNAIGMGPGGYFRSQDRL